MCESLTAVLGAVSAVVLSISTWVALTVRKVGVLPPRAPKNAKMPGRRAQLGDGLGYSHYAIFSSSGQWGNGEIVAEKLVVYIHGMAAQLGQLSQGVDGGFAQSLVDAGYTLLAIDILGHGFSDAPDIEFTTADFVRQVVTLLHHLGVTKPFHLIGFSYGCFIALTYAAEQPGMLKSLTLTSPFGAVLPLHSWKIVAAFYAFFVHLLFEGNMSQLRTIYRMILHMEGRRLPELLNRLNYNTHLSMMLIAGSWETDPLLRVLQTAKHIHEKCRRSRLYVLPQGHHMSWVNGSTEQQHTFRAQIIEFLSEMQMIEMPEIRSLP